ncbi:MAG: DNA recombination protein RmuC [Pseudomonadota bacterium]
MNEYPRLNRTWTFEEYVMTWIPIVVALSAGFVLGLLAALMLRIIQSRTSKQLADELFQESEVQRKANIEAIMDNIKANFGNLSLEALSRSTAQFLELAKSKLDLEREVSAKELEAKKGLIDEQLRQMTAQLENVSSVVQILEKDRVEKFGELASQLKSAGEQTSNEILSLLGAFKKQWHEFLRRLEVLGKRIEDAQREYEVLTTTRVRQLERPLNKIEELRTQREISLAPDQDEGLIAG